MTKSEKKIKLDIGWRGQGGKDSLPGGFSFFWSLLMLFSLAWQMIWKSAIGLAIAFVFFLVICSSSE
jgi:hypothetical protein